MQPYKAIFFARMVRANFMALVAYSIFSAFSGSLHAATLISSWATNHQSVNAQFDADWKNSRNAIRLGNGWLFARNDSKTLFLLIDLTGDTGNDPPLNSSPWGDYLSLTVDIDLNRKISPNIDFQYGQYPGTFRIGRQYFLAADRFTGLKPSDAKLVSGFSASRNFKRPHRLWELAIPLKEIKTKPGKTIRVGIGTHSNQPAFNHSVPRNHTRSMGSLIELRLASSPIRVQRPDIQINPSVLREMVAKHKLVIVPMNSDLQPLTPGVGGISANRPNTPCELPKGKPDSRGILPDGTIELRYANGAKKRRKKGSWEILCPDGTIVPATVLYSTQIPPTLPPSLPDETAAQWLEYHNWQLLGIIDGLVGDQAMLNSYLQTEATEWTIYQRIQSRRETISYLLAE